MYMTSHCIFALDLYLLASLCWLPIFSLPLYTSLRKTQGTIPTPEPAFNLAFLLETSIAARPRFMVDNLTALAPSSTMVE